MANCNVLYCSADSPRKFIVIKPKCVRVCVYVYTHSSNHLSEELNSITAAAAAKSLQSCPTLCDPRDGSPPGSAVPGILQARTLEWVAISFSNA